MKAVGQDGFTLLELLVSMTLLGLVFVLLFGGLRFGTRAWERGNSETDNTDAVRVTQALLRNEIEQACPRRVYSTERATEPRVEFVGTSRRLLFRAPAPQSLDAASCPPAALVVEPSRGLEDLSIWVAPSGSGWLKTDLIHGAQVIDIAYLDAPGAAWQNIWPKSGHLPALVRIRAVFPSGDSRIWPDLFAVPRVSAEADCVYDVNTKFCQGH